VEDERDKGNERRRFEAWEKYTDFKYHLKKTLKKEADDGERSR
jgi:hypothetical protein